MRLSQEQQKLFKEFISNNVNDIKSIVTFADSLGINYTELMYNVDRAPTKTEDKIRIRSEINKMIEDPNYVPPQHKSSELINTLKEGELKVNTSDDKDTIKDTINEETHIDFDCNVGMDLKYVKVKMMDGSVLDVPTNQNELRNFVRDCYSTNLLNARNYHNKWYKRTGEVIHKRIANICDHWGRVRPRNEPEVKQELSPIVTATQGICGTFRVVDGKIKYEFDQDQLNELLGLGV